MPELAAVFSSRQVLQKMTSHKLLSDRRSALRKDHRTQIIVLRSDPYRTCNQSSNPDLASTRGITE